MIIQSVALFAPGALWHVPDVRVTSASLRGNLNANGIQILEPTSSFGSEEHVS